jgi:ABC-type nickel/cobalt efflux system permease component RcnA
MFGLDDKLASVSDGTTLVVVLGVAVLLGLRHATDPDHLAAVSTLIAGGRERGARIAARLGLAWGIGHAATLFAFGLPIVLFQHMLPEPVQQGAETAVGVLIVGLAVWLLVRWRRGVFHLHLHEHRHATNARTPLQAFGIGLVHGMGGSAGVGVLLLATVDDRALAAGALGILAVFTAVSMTLVTSGLGLTLATRPMRALFPRTAPALAFVSLAFGTWYALAALELAPYYL